MTESQENRVLEIEMGSDEPIPQDGPKYPWKDLAEKAGVGNFIVRGYKNEAEAKAGKQTIYSSGFSYYSSRELSFTPVVRHLQVDEGEWVVRVWAKATSEE